MSLSIRMAALSLSFIVVIAAVYWFGAAAVPSVNDSVPAASSFAVAGGDHSAAGHPVSADEPSVARPDVTPLPAKAPLTQQERQLVLTEFFKAAEKDVTRLQAEISKAKADGLALADIAAMEEKLRKMQAVIQQVQARNPGY